MNVHEILFLSKYQILKKTYQVNFHFANISLRQFKIDTFVYVIWSISFGDSSKNLEQADVAFVGLFWDFPTVFLKSTLDSHNIFFVKWLSVRFRVFLRL